MFSRLCYFVWVCPSRVRKRSTKNKRTVHPGHATQECEFGVAQRPAQLGALSRIEPITNLVSLFTPSPRKKGASRLSTPIKPPRPTQSPPSGNTMYTLYSKPHDINIPQGDGIICSHTQLQCKAIKCLGTLRVHASGTSDPLALVDRLKQ